MDNSLHSRGGKELSDVADSMNLVMSHLTDRVHMGVESEAVIKKDPQHPGVLKPEISSSPIHMEGVLGLLLNLEWINRNFVLPSFNLSWLMGIQSQMSSMQASNLASISSTLSVSVSSYARYS